MGCASQGLFSLFSGFSPQCGPVNSQIDQMRGKLDRTTSELEQLKSGNDNQQNQRSAVIGQLAQNNCGAQYTAAARPPVRKASLKRCLAAAPSSTPAVTAAHRHLSHRLRAHLRRLLFPDFVFDGAEPFRRR